MMKDIVDDEEMFEKDLNAAKRLIQLYDRWDPAIKPMDIEYLGEQYAEMIGRTCGDVIEGTRCSYL